MDEKTATRQRICEAAGKRFMHYGYAKTAMAEIARDLGMSTGNLYRFYESKLDIAEEIASWHDAQEDEVLQEIVARPDPALDRLRRFMFTMLERTFETMANPNKKAFEIAQAISRERPAYPNKRLAAERVFLRKILADGIAEGALKPLADLDQTAEMIQCATMKYRYPQLYCFLSLEQLERELAGVFDLIVSGIAAR